MARVRVWVDGELIGDITDRRTLNREDSFLESFNFFTYWDNDGAHQTQSFYADDLTITSETPLDVDEHGNPFIGMGPIPKPGSMDLLSTGVALLLFRRRHARKP